MTSSIRLPSKESGYFKKIIVTLRALDTVFRTYTYQLALLRLVFWLVLLFSSGFTMSSLTEEPKAGTGDSGRRSRPEPVMRLNRLPLRRRDSLLFAPLSKSASLNGSGLSSAPGVALASTGGGGIKASFLAARRGATGVASACSFVKPSFFRK